MLFPLKFPQRSKLLRNSLSNSPLLTEMCASNVLRLENSLLCHRRGGNTGRRNIDIEGQLWFWNRQRKLGVAFNSSTAFHLPNGADRSPDAAWVSQARWDALTREEQETFPPLCPDFALELRSKTDNMEPLRQKMQEYLDNGLLLGWLIDTKNKKVEVYRLDQPVEVLDNPTILSGEGVLPGFVLDLQVVLG